jgi:hypothetical protein
MIKEHDRIVLTCGLPQDRLVAGDVGSVIHIYERGKAMEVEFMPLDGETLAIATLRADQVRPIARGEITHARHLATT